MEVSREMKFNAEIYLIFVGLSVMMIGAFLAFLGLGMMAWRILTT
jgi:hypothetical protein